MHIGAFIISLRSHRSFAHPTWLNMLSQQQKSPCISAEPEGIQIQRPWEYLLEACNSNLEVHVRFGLYQLLLLGSLWNL